MKRTIESRIAQLFSMSEATWERHANPWSVWTRFTALPLLILAIWSRVSIGDWAWGLFLLAVFWIWINPRLFSKPSSTDNWASKAVLGERLWMDRDLHPIPPHHRLAPLLLSLLSAMGIPFLAWGLWALDLWPTLLGTILIYAGKVWFLDRMVWLYEETRPDER